MKYIGAHLSAARAGGLAKLPGYGKEIGATAFALFTKNQKKWFENPLSEQQISEFKKNCQSYQFSAEHILPHGSYLLNIGSPEQNILKLTRSSLIEEARRCEMLGLKYLNIHLGAHKKLISPQECLKICAETVNYCLQKTDSIEIVLENSAGQGTRVGYLFEHISQVIELVEDKERVGVCLDTCHAFGGGYDLRTANDCRQTFAEFDDVVGFNWLRAMHLNDSLIELGSHKDRHAPLGEGLIGMTCFEYIMHDSRFDGIPLILETPKPERWADEIKKLKEMMKE
jgi:deoxyribonuclease-4